MHYYLKHIFRTFWRNKASSLGGICTIALGIFVYISMIDVLYNLDDQLQNYYAENQFAQVFATVSQMPRQNLTRLEEITGIAEADGRLSGDLRLQMPEQNRIISLHVLGYSEGNSLNQITLLPAPGDIGENQIFIGEKMCNVYHFTQQQSITLLLGEREETFTFAGEAREPEYIYTLPSDGMMPDGSVYDLAVMEEKTLERLLQKENQVTELGFRLQPGYIFSDVQAPLEVALQPYGLQVLTDREHQSSYHMLQSEYSQLQTIGTVLPLIFMLISVFMLYIVLRKLIFQERSRIGTMKAFGFTDTELISAYLKQSVVTGISGAVLGSMLAIPFGIFMYEMYLDYFSLPEASYHSYLSTRLIGLAIGVGTSMAATYLGVREILQVLPAESMRPTEPPVKKQLQLGRLGLKPRQKMALQTIYQNKMRSAVIALAIAFPFAMVAVLSSFDSIAKQMYYDQFQDIQTYDLKITLQHYQPPDEIVAAARQLGGVYQAEAMGTFSVQLQHENHKELAALYLLPEDSALFHVMDVRQQYYQPRADGLLMNAKVAEKLQVAAGDTVEVSNSWLAADSVKMPVLAVLEESFGGGCYLQMDGCQRYFNTVPLANAVMLRTFDGDQVKEQLLESGRVISMTDAAQTLAGYEEMMGSMLLMIDLFAGLSVLAGFILIYNILGISLRERRNEFGTLTMLGVSDREIARMIGTEQLIHLLLGLLLGIPFSVALCRLMEHLVAEDIYTIHVTVAPGSYVLALVTAVFIVIGSTALLVREQLRLDPSELLRERE